MTRGWMLVGLLMALAGCADDISVRRQLGLPPLSAYGKGPGGGYGGYGVGYHGGGYGGGGYGYGGRR